MAEGEVKTRIVIEGEAEYKKALADINRSLRESKSELKAVSAEFAGNGVSAQALSAQIGVLEKTHAQQSEQLQLMQEHLQKVTAAYGDNSREAVELRTKINNARAEMAKTANDLTQLRTRLDATGDAMGDLAGETGGAESGIKQIGEQARDAQDDVDELSRSIADMMGDKLISIGIGKDVVSKLGEQLAGLISGAIGSAIAGQTEDAMARALAGDDTLSERRTSIKDAIDRTWAGYRDGSQTVNDVAVVDTVLGNKGITDEERVKAITDMAITQSVVFGRDVQATMDTATSMVNAFGLSYEQVIDLMTRGQRDMSDGGAMMLSAFETYPQLFAQIGYDADDMYSAIATAANDVNLGKDSAFVKGVETMVSTITSGSKESVETLRALGIEATDLPKKLQQGGDTAAQAIQLILTRLLAVEDVSKRNELGKALLGDKVWMDSAGGIAEVILSGYGQVVDASGATRDAMTSVLHTWDAQLAGLGERVGQRSDEIFQPLVEAGTDALTSLNQNIDSEGGSLAKGWFTTLEQARRSMGLMAAQAYTGLEGRVTDGYDALQERIRGFATDAAAAMGSAFDAVVSAGGQTTGQIGEAFFADDGGMGEEAARRMAGRWVDALRGGMTAEAAAGAQESELDAIVSGMLPDDGVLRDRAKTYAQSHKAAVVAQLETAYGQETDEDFAAWQAFQDAMIDSAYDEGTSRAQERGTGIARALVQSIKDAGAEMSRDVSESFFGKRTDDSGEDSAESTGERWVDAIRKGVKTGTDSADASGAVTGMLEGMLPDDTELSTTAKDYATRHKGAVVTQLGEAYGQETDGDFAAWQAFQAAMIDSAYEQSVEDAGKLGEDESQSTIDAVSSASPAAQRMGEYFGGELVLGTEDGAEGMYDAGEDAAQGAIDGARSGINSMYEAGAALGGAFRRGFRDKMLIKSPSRAAMEDMAYVTEGYLTQAERDRERVAGAANELAMALREGFTAPKPGAGYGVTEPTGTGAAGMTPESLREALSGMAFVLDAESMSVRLEPYVSRATSARVTASSQGQSNLSRSW